MVAERVYQVIARTIQTFGPQGVKTVVRYQILSNGKPLQWLYWTQSDAEYALRDIMDRAESRRRRSAWRKANGHAVVRDSKRKAAYKAERLAGMMAYAPMTMTVEQMAVQCREWAREAGFTRVVHPRIKYSGRKRGGAHCFVSEIVLSKGNGIGVLIHEYAHALTWEEKPAHGPQWAYAYVKLTRVALGGEQADKLASEFRKIGFNV